MPSVLRDLEGDLAAAAALGPRCEQPSGSERRRAPRSPLDVDVEPRLERRALADEDQRPSRGGERRVTSIAQ
jgi:hypothetical protein